MGLPLRRSLSYSLAAIALTAAAIGVPVGAPKAHAADTTCPWMDTSLTPGQRARALLHASSWGQKIRWLTEPAANDPEQKGVLEAWYPGVEQGPALAALLWGDVNPAGRLPVTFPKSTADLPTAGSVRQYPGVVVNGIRQVHYSEGLKVGYRWYDSQRIEPLFPFGYGLSYTTFAVGCGS
ncbi:MAG: glycoside hydrolase family 3 C-terminal domain-containing protein [Nocardioidaceae bacterium]